MQSRFCTGGLSIYWVSSWGKRFDVLVQNVFKCCFLTCIQVSQEADQVVWYSHLLKNVPQFLVIFFMALCIFSVKFLLINGGDGIPVELFQILKDDAVKVLHSICQQIWKTQQWLQDWKRSVFIPTPKKGNAQECSDYCTIALISHTSKVMLKARL